MRTPIFSRSHRGGAVAVALALILAAPAAATNYSWISATGGSASTAGFWSPTGIPGALDNAFFGPNASYGVTWGSPADTLASLAVQSGRPHFNMSPADPLGIQGQLLVQAESLTVLGGLLRCGHYVVGSGNTGNLLLSGTSTSLVAAGNTGSYIGDGGIGYAQVQGGAKLDSYGSVTMGFGPGDQCVTTVIGGNIIQHIFSGLRTLVASPGAQGDLTVGNQGGATLYLQNAGFADIAGDLFVGRNSGGVGVIVVANTPNGVGNPFLTVHGITDIGHNDSPGSQAGDGHLEVSRGTSSLLGHTNVEGGVLQVDNGATLNASGGITIVMHSPPGPEPPLILATGANSHAEVGSSFVIGDGSTRLTNGPQSIPVKVENGAVLDYTGTGNLMSLDTDGWLEVSGSTVTSTTEIQNAGYISLASGTVQAPLVHCIQKNGFSGFISGHGTVSGRVLLEPNAYITADGALTVGDSTASDGFVSLGQIGVNGVTMTVLDLDGADLGRVVLAGNPVPGELNLPHGGRTTSILTVQSGQGQIDGDFFNDGLVHLDGQLFITGHMTQFNGSTEGNGYLTINSGARLSARNWIFGPLILNGALDLGAAPDGLQIGTLQVNGGGTVRLRLGPSASTARDSLLINNAFLSGTLDLPPGPLGYPAPGDTVILMRFSGAYSGSFATVTENGIPAAGHLSVVYGPNTVKVVRLDNTGVAPGAGGLALRFATTGSLQHPAMALELPWSAAVRVELYDVTGRALATLADGPMEPGRHDLPLRSAELPSGIYFGRASIAHDGVPRVLRARMVLTR